MPAQVVSLPADKPKIVWHAAMMAIQNWGFFHMYWDLSGFTPGPVDTPIAIGDEMHSDPCKSTRDACSFMSLTCFFVGFLCVGMGFGGYTDDFKVFWLYWLLHLVGGACYTVCTILVPLARFSDVGKKCAELSPVNGDRVELVWIVHAALYLVYVGGMLSITYFSFLKPTFFSKKASDKVADVV